MPGTASERTTALGTCWPFETTRPHTVRVVRHRDTPPLVGNLVGGVGWLEGTGSPEHAVWCACAHDAGLGAHE